MIAYLFIHYIRRVSIFILKFFDSFSIFQKCIKILKNFKKAKKVRNDFLHNFFPIFWSLLVDRRQILHIYFAVKGFSVL